jgi:DNA polymerase III delta' subunit
VNEPAGGPGTVGLRTVGQPAAVAAVRSMAVDPPHAILIVGPPSSGKATLAADLAALLLCERPLESRPCRACRGCRRVASGNHPDLHLLAPSGAADRIGLGGDPAMPGVRDLVAALALRPVEGTVRVAVVERAHRLSEDAQHALLKTLEEPPAGTVIVLCTEDEDALLATVRSRCARLRLGPVGPRAIEDLLESEGLADRPTAARLARLARGRPGVAVRLAESPEVVTARGELARLLIDLAGERCSVRLVRIREALARAVGVLDQGPGVAPDAGSSEAPRSAADRRRAAQLMIAIWRDVAYDAALARLGSIAPDGVNGSDRAGDTVPRDPDLLEETRDLGAAVPVGSMPSFLARLDEAARRLDVSASPELTLDVLALRWPSRVD